MADLDVLLEHVDKTYAGGVRAVIDFNAEIRHGEFVAMLGPSGCGKTTTLRMIGGLEEVTEGRIFIAGKDVTDLPPARRDTSMMFQSFALFPHRTVFQNVEFSLKMKGMEKSERDRRVWEMLEMVGLAGFATRRPRDLSGGQQQRVALARALISRPAVLLLDEPLGSLDFNLRQAMMVELKKVQRELNITFIMVTHSQQEAMPSSSRSGRHARCTRTPGRNSWRNSSATTTCFTERSARAAVRSSSWRRSANCFMSRSRIPPGLSPSAGRRGSRFAPISCIPATTRTWPIASRGDTSRASSWARSKPMSSRLHPANMSMSSSTGMRRTAATRWATARCSAGMPRRGSCSKIRAGQTISRDRDSGTSSAKQPIRSDSRY